MSFRPPQEMPGAPEPEPVELEPTGRITEYTHPEYQDRAPKSGTEFDAETAELLQSLDDVYKLTENECREVLRQCVLLNLTSKHSMAERLSDPRTAPRALELLRQAYTVYPFETSGGVTDYTERDKSQNSEEFDPEYFSEFVVESLGAFDRELQRTDLDEKTMRRMKNNLFYVVSEAQDTIVPEHRQAVEAWIESHWSQLDALDPFFCEPEDLREDRISLYARRNIFTRSDNEALAERSLSSLMNMYFHPAQNGYPPEIKEYAFNPILSEKHKKNLLFNLRQRRLVEALASGYGLERSILDKWEEARVADGQDEDGKDRTAASYWENLKAVSKLEEKRPGSASELYKQYGIANFARYREGMLLRQLEIVNEDVPYGVIIYPEADWNGAFSHNSNQLYETSLRLRTGGFETRIVEAGSQRELARRLLRLHKKYAPVGNKFSFAIVAGHGQKDSVALGNARPISPPPPWKEGQTAQAYEAELLMWQSIQSQDVGSFVSEDFIEGDGINRALTEWFDIDAPKILISCSTGESGGIAEKVSFYSSGEVIAPKIPTNVKKIDVTFDQDGKPRFSVEYHEGETRRYIAGDQEE